MKNSSNAVYSISVKVNKEDLEIARKLKVVHSINISMFFKNCLRKKLIQLDGLDSLESLDNKVPKNI